MQNYFNYFTEIEEHFQRRRGSLLLLSTLDWALIETWREAGIPLEAVLQGIDAAFDKYDARKNKARVRRVNGLAYCAQEVISAVEAMKEAAVGAAPARPRRQRSKALNRNASPPIWKRPRSSSVQGRRDRWLEIADRLQALAQDARRTMPNLEELEQSLTALEEKLFAIILTTTPGSRAARAAATGQLRTCSLPQPHAGDADPPGRAAISA